VGEVAPLQTFQEGIAMKFLSVLLLTAAVGLGFASATFAECAGHAKTATVTPPSVPVASTSKT
jgi:hypothetical protein